MTELKLKNYMEDIVAGDIVQVMEQIGCCTCEACKLDVMAIALNNLTPCYVVTEKGEIYARTRELTLQYRTDVAAAIAKGATMVKERPRHE
ncbi:MAG: late competence development ComFB family protein [Oscillospiraceae bacterium]|jgi:competence protein ComFB|nr:late competence development ComFB family protein [Oscillospiraceae bacterium]